MPLTQLSPLALPWRRYGSFSRGTVLPAPTERNPFKGKKAGTEEIIERKPLPEAPLSALVFKTVADPFAGKLTLLRVFSGTLKSDSMVYNSSKRLKEKFGQLLILEGKKQQPTEMAVAGDILAIPKLKETGTGDTLSAENEPIIYAPTSRLPPVISYAVEAKVKGSEDKLFSSFARLLEEDATLRLERDQATSEIKGMPGRLPLAVHAAMFFTWFWVISLSLH